MAFPTKALSKAMLHSTNGLLSLLLIGSQHLVIPLSRTKYKPRRKKVQAKIPTESSRFFPTFIESVLPGGLARGDVAEGDEVI